MSARVWIARDASGASCEVALGRGELSPATASQWRAAGYTWALEPAEAWCETKPPTALSLFTKPEAARGGTV